ncbi:hypothetical protein SAMN05518871_101101 [Psychrobacillus sp. OK028]|uniref:hypothetical protein n=1 Tax=Psychrobacillus sp. OK028 TaxID=1884359 RepID=UPI00088D41A6|nr:hypothetical protein [Psychrobacillus sp. OK028]SDM38945.1 hypothetical protein SAMN05518871_101101 [Psychrobacillus sp. OK028]
MKIAKIGILFDEKEAELNWLEGRNIFGSYLFEILDHVRLPYKRVSATDEFKSFDVLIVSHSSNSEEASIKILAYAEAGGTVISYGGLDAIRSKLGFSKPYISKKGYADLSNFLKEQTTPLRFLGAEPWKQEMTLDVTDFGSLADEEKTWQDASALQQIKYGTGTIERWSIAIPQTIVALQQGTKPVVEDGPPAPDGSANLDEGILKAEDGFELDWDLDRAFTETGMPYFPHPYADLWKEVIMEHLLKIVLEKGLTLPFLDYWPADVQHVAMISHDSDLNVDESAQITLDTLKAENVQTTWCMIAPGYSSSIYDQIKKDGHEIALHYNALEQDEGVWSKEAFKTQLAWVEKVTNTKHTVSNKNHYTRFEGWGELYAWCENNGIQVDQSRGPSKKGNVGFLFGTCHPYFPIAWADEKNRLYDVLEIGFLTQDLNHNTLSDVSIVQPFLDGVKRVNGVAHFLFHQYHIYHQPKVREAIVQLITTAKDQGFTFWTSKQINDWERARRRVKIDDISCSGALMVSTQDEENDFVILIPVDENHEDGAVVKRFGISCKQVKVKRS